VVINAYSLVREGAAVILITSKRDRHHSQQTVTPVNRVVVDWIVIYRMAAYAKRVSFCVAQEGTYVPG